MPTPKVVTGFANVNAARLYYEVAGSGPAVVLIHGFSLDTRMWDAQFEEFAGRHTVLRYDVRGFGKSALPQDRYSNADDLKALLDFLGIKRAALCGLSMGGTIATEFAFRYPGMASAYIPVDSANGPMIKPGDVEAGTAWADFDKSISGVRPAMKSGGRQAAIKVWLESPLFAPERRLPKVKAALETIVGDYSGWHWANPPPYLPIKPDPGTRFQDLRVPTLVVVGEQDMLAFQLVARAMSKDIPGARLAVIPGAGHMSNMDAPQEFNRVVLDFLAAI